MFVDEQVQDEEIASPSSQPSSQQNVDDNTSSNDDDSHDDMSSSSETQVPESEEKDALELDSTVGSQDDQNLDQDFSDEEEEDNIQDDFNYHIENDDMSVSSQSQQRQQITSTTDDVFGIGVTTTGEMDDDTDSNPRKNLSMSFETAYNQQKSTIKTSSSSRNGSSSSSGSISRAPPLHPNLKKANKNAHTMETTTSLTVNTTIDKKPKSTTTSNTSKSTDSKNSKPLLSVFLRIRPPSSRSSTSSDEQEENTIEVLPSQEYPTKIRTFPPLQSNKSKSHRSANNGGISVRSTASPSIRTLHHSKKKPLNSAQNDLCRASESSSLLRNSSITHQSSGSNSITTSSSSETVVVGIKEFEFNRVFDPDCTQHEMYDIVASPLVQGLFPHPQDRIDEDDKRKRQKSSEGLPIMRSSSTSSTKKKGGKSALLFAYGITNAGKTHTMLGNTTPSHTQHDKTLKQQYSLHQEAGVLPRALHQIFVKINESEESKSIYQVRLSYLEIYNEQIFDLLHGDNNINNGTNSRKNGTSFHATNNHLLRLKQMQSSSKPLKLREDPNGHTFVHGLSKHTIKNVEEGLKLVKMASERKQTSSNNINQNSSRSHCICQIELVTFNADDPDGSGEGGTKKKKTATTGSTVKSMISRFESGALVDRKRKNDSIDSTMENCTSSTTMWIVDLAGSERTKRTATSGKLGGGAKLRKETTLINASLMNLMRCLQILRQNSDLLSRRNKKKNSNPEIVPFRESKLTHLLMNHLNRTSSSSEPSTHMIVNVNPSVVDFDETQHVLAYASDAKQIKMSVEDYTLKRGKKAISDGEELDEEKSRKRAKSPTRKKMEKLVKKLSPRSLRNRANKGKQKSSTKQTTATTSTTSTNSKWPTSLQSNSKISKHKQQQEFDRIMQLYQNDNIVLQKSIIQLESEIKVLQQETIQRDEEIRREVAEEMECEIRKIQDRYDLLLESSQKTPQVPTPMKLIKSLEHEQQQQKMEELQDQIMECEEEMERMRENFDSSLKKKDEEMDLLRKEVDLLIMEKQQKEKEEKERELLEDEDKENEYDENKMTNASNTINVTATAGLRSIRLPRNRCSEVACVSIPTELEKKQDSSSSLVSSNKGSSSSKKKGMIRYPLRSKNNK